MATPNPPAGQNVQTMTWPKGAHEPGGNALKTTAKASYTPSAPINPFAYGTTTKTKAAVLGTVPEVAVGGASESAPLPHAFDGHFSVGDDKNVSTPVTGS